MVTMREERGHEVYLTHLWSLKLWRVEKYGERLLYYGGRESRQTERASWGMGSGEGIKIVDITHKIEKVQWHNL